MQSGFPRGRACISSMKPFHSDSNSNQEPEQWNLSIQLRRSCHLRHNAQICPAKVDNSAEYFFRICRRKPGTHHYYFAVSRCYPVKYDKLSLEFSEQTVKLLSD